MEEIEISRFITSHFDGIDVVVASRENGAPAAAWGDSFFFYDPDRRTAPDRRLPFATIVTQDYGTFDCASNLNRQGVFRLNISVSAGTFRDLFGSASAVYDFTALDQLLPHPIHAAQFWVCILNPSLKTFEKIKPLLAEAHERAVSKYAA